MRLLWIRYTTKQQSHHALFLVIGDQGGNLIALKSNAMVAGDVKKVRATMKYLEVATVEQRIDWLKHSCPSSYRRAFRRLPTGSYEIISEHQPQST